MSNSLFLLPEIIKSKLLKRYKNEHKKWLAGQGSWPLTISLGCPTEEQAINLYDAFIHWTNAWQNWNGAGKIEQINIQWPTLGTQRLPIRIKIFDPCEVAGWIGEGDRWEVAQSRYSRFITRWPILSEILPRYFNMLADYTDGDIQNLEDVLAWLILNPTTNLFIRQVPVPGVHSKWLEKRYSLILELLASIKGDLLNNTDFHQYCGLRKSPHPIRMKFLDSRLRQCFGGLGDISAPLEEWKKLEISISRAFIIENIQTGLAFTDIPGSIVIMGLGYGVTLLEQLHWLMEAECIYWGDIDTNGFSILNHARSRLPHLKSVLMDEVTLMRCESLWGNEKEQHLNIKNSHLTDSENYVYTGLIQQRWAVNLRLEQEHIPWNYAWENIQLLA